MNIKVSIMLKRTLFFSIFFALSAAVFVNQGFGMRKSDAQRASEILKPRMVIRKYCAPCGDSRWKHITIKNVKVKHKGYNYRLLVNGREANLAYYYIKIHGNWVNIAMLLGMDVPESLEFLPAQARIP